MYTPYTAHDLVRVMEQELNERRAVQALRMRGGMDAELRRPALESARSRFATMLLRVSRLAPS